MFLPSLLFAIQCANCVGSLRIERVSYWIEAGAATLAIRALHKMGDTSEAKVTVSLNALSQNSYSCIQSLCARFIVVVIPSKVFYIFWHNYQLCCCLFSSLISPVSLLCPGCRAPLAPRPPLLVRPVRPSVRAHSALIGHLRVLPARAKQSTFNCNSNVSSHSPPPKKPTTKTLTLNRICCNCIVMPIYPFSMPNSFVFHFTLLLVGWHSPTVFSSPRSALRVEHHFPL